VIAREIALDLSREISDTRLLPGQSATLRYRRKLRAAGISARLSVVVYPDAFYTGFYEVLLRQGAGRGAAQIRRGTRGDAALALRGLPPRRAAILARKIHER